MIGNVPAEHSARGICEPRWWASGGRQMFWALAAAPMFLFVTILLEPVAHADTSAPKRCERHVKGTIDCRRPEKGKYEYSWPVTPDMIGQTVDASSLSLGVTVFPPVQRVAPGQKTITFQVSGAHPGQTVRLAKKLLQPNPERQESSDLCCIEDYEVEIPDEPVACKQSALPVPPAGPPANRRTQSKRPQIEVHKYCPSCAAGGKCRCMVTVRNVGTDRPRDAIHLQDEATMIGGGSAALLRIAEITPDGEDWDCTQNGGAMSCTLPAAALNPISARSVAVTYEPLKVDGGQGPRVHNCARLMSYAETVSVKGYTEACADFGSDIVVQKSGGSDCRIGDTCSFDLTLSNRGQGPFSGKLMLGDNLTFAAGSEMKADIVSIEPPLGCAVSPKSLPFSCVTHAALVSGEARTHHVSLRLSQQKNAVAASPGGLKGRNCFAVIGQPYDEVGSRNSINDVLQNVSTTVSPGRGGASAGASACVEFAALPRCPGDLALQGSQCSCPGNAERYEDDRCRSPCAQGEVRTGGICSKPEAAAPAAICPAGYTGTYPNCAPPAQATLPDQVCPEGYWGRYPECSPVVYEKRTKPRDDAPTGGASPVYDPKPPKRKAADQDNECSGSTPYGDWPNCCQRGYYYKNGDCIRPPVRVERDEPQPAPNIVIDPKVVFKDCHGKQIPFWKDCPDYSAAKPTPAPEAKPYYPPMKTDPPIIKKPTKPYVPEKSLRGRSLI